MRLSGDCPLVQADLCDKVAEAYFRSGCDYLGTGSTFAEGLDCEIFSYSALDKAWQEAKLKSEREHVTLYFRNHPELFTNGRLENDTDDSRYRITVDQNEDFLVVKSLIQNLYAEKGYFRIEDIKMNRKK